MAFSPALLARRGDAHDDMHTAAEQGRICALATECQRDLQKCAAAHPELFPAEPFGPTVFSGVALANAFGSPAATAGQIRVAARTALWAFAVDWLIDYAATSRAQVEAIVTGCAAVGEGAAPAPGVPLQVFLAELRDEVATGPAWPGLAPIWRDHLRRYLRANAREWDWKTGHRSGHPLPTLEEYLTNADNFGSAFVNASHWIHNGAVRAAEPLTRLMTAGAEVQRTLRLVNDLATYERDLSWGDLNGLMLGVDRDQIAERITRLADGAKRLIEGLTGELPAEAAYLRRQLGYSVGYYGLSDYWGERGDDRRPAATGGEAKSR